MIRDTIEYPYVMLQSLDLRNNSLKKKNISILTFSLKNKSADIFLKKIVKEKNLIKFLNPILSKKVKKKILFSSVVPKVYQKINKFLNILFFMYNILISLQLIEFI